MGGDLYAHRTFYLSIIFYYPMLNSALQIFRRLFALFSVCFYLAGGGVCAEQYYNFKIGDNFYLDLLGTFSVAYDTNISSSGFNPQADFIISPGLFITSDWQITDYNDLSLTLGMEMHKYLEHSELDSINNFISILPGSDLSFSVFIGDLTVTLSEGLTYTIDPTDAFGVNLSNNTIRNNVIDYGRFYNRLALDFDWDLNDVQVGFELFRFDVIPTSSTFDYTQRTQYGIMPFIEFNLSPTLMVGLKGEATTNEYRVNFENNSTSYSIGPMWRWLIASNLEFNGEVDYIYYDFDQNGINGDTTSPDGLEFNLSLEHIFTERFVHRLYTSRYLEYGSISNITTVYDLGYSFVWRIMRRTNWRGVAIYDRGSDSGGPRPEKYNRYTVGTGFDYLLSDRLTASLDFSYQHKTSDLLFRSYDKARVILYFAYDF